MDNKTNPDKEWIRRLTSGRKAESKVNDAPRSASATRDAKQPAGKTAGGFGDVAGMEELKQMVTESFINVLNHRECAAAYGITPPSMLFYGPAGCGKTFFAEKMAEEVGINFMKVAPDDLASIYMHGTQEKVGELFRKAEQQAPVLLFFDEFDALVPQRNSDPNNYQANEVNEFLCMLNNANQRGIYVLAATNHPERIDRAVLRTGRIDEVIYIDMPDLKARESLFRLKLSRLPVADDIDYAALAALSQGYTCSDIDYIVKTAARRMFNASIRQPRQPYQAITQSLLADAIAHRSPSVTSRDLREFERLRSLFSPKDAGLRPATIGFRA